MGELLKQVAGSIALGVEFVSVLTIAYGAAEALVGVLTKVIGRHSPIGVRKAIWLRFGVWLLLGLEFQLAADIVRTAISPNWRDIGELAAIGAIRTFLNYFLEKDIEKYGEGPKPAEPA